MTKWGRVPPSRDWRFSNILGVHITAYGIDMNKWDTRYNTEEYVFGKRPNRFLIDSASSLAPGKVLCLGEGEGRNAVYLASIGWKVTAVDISPYGIKKARLLARQRESRRLSRYGRSGAGHRGGRDQ